MNKYLLLVVLNLVGLSTHANIKLPALIGDHMVLQRDKPIPIWGYAKPGEIIQIKFAGRAYQTITNTEGKWSTKLSPLKAGGPYKMVLSGENVITLNDILMGDVWICSGQSNMEFPLSIANNAEREIKNANYPHIRLYTVEKAIALTPKTEAKGNWSACSGESVKNFTAVGYFFARNLQQKINIPIGLINSSWGGTVIESWISKEGLQGEHTFGEKAKQAANFDTAAYNKEHRKVHQDWVESFNRHDAGFVNGQYVWANNQLNNNDWKPINLPTIWEFTGF